MFDPKRRYAFRLIKNGVKNLQKKEKITLCFPSICRNELKTRLYGKIMLEFYFNQVYSITVKAWLG